MFKLVRKIWHIFIIFVIAVIFSYFLFFLFLHPLNLVFFLGDKLNASPATTNTATVQANPINTLALQLSQKEQELSKREEELNNRSAQIEKQNNFWNNSVLLAIFLSLSLLGILVIVNFYYDRRRENELKVLEEKETKESMLREVKNS